MNCKNCEYSNIFSVKGMTFGMKTGYIITFSGFLINPDSCFNKVSIEETPDGQIEQTPNEFYSKYTKNSDGECKDYKRKWWKFWVKNEKNRNTRR